MLVEKHHLIHDLPEHAQTIHTLKTENAHFEKLFNEYHDVTHEIHGVETNDVNVSDNYFEGLKVKRAYLKDKLYAMIKSINA